MFKIIIKPILKLAFLSLILISCNNKENKKINDIETMKSNLIQYMNDNAFKENGKLTIYKFEIIKVDTVSKNLVDSAFIISEITLKLKELVTQGQYSIAKAKQYKALYELSSLADQPSSEYRDEMKKYAKEANLYSDSITYFNKILDSIRYGISKNVNKSNIYEMKSFIKATLYINKDSVNILDTTFYYFNKDFKVYNNKNYDFKLKN